MKNEKEKLDISVFKGQKVVQQNLQSFTKEEMEEAELEYESFFATMNEKFEKSQVSSYFEIPYVIRKKINAHLLVVSIILVSIIVLAFLKVVRWEFLALLFVFGLSQAYLALKTYLPASKLSYYIIMGNVINVKPYQKKLEILPRFNRSYNQFSALLVQIANDTDTIAFVINDTEAPIQNGTPITLFVAEDVKITSTEFGMTINDYLGIEYSAIDLVDVNNDEDIEE